MDPLRIATSLLVLTTVSWRTTMAFRPMSFACGWPLQSTKSALCMVQNRGLEIRREGATPTEGGMTLYLKAAADGTLVGDCPFAHFVRLVLEEKGLQYELKPCTEDTKPAWLTEYYEGKLPALRHRKECYVESDVIADYLDFFCPDPSLKGGKKEMDEAEDAISGFFPSVAKYLKHIPDGDDEDQEMKCSLESVLLRLEEHLQLENRTGPYLVGNGEKLTLLDCSLSPKLYHLRTGIEAFKDNAIDLAQKFPAVNEYLDSMLKRESFQKTVYDKDVIIWGWSNARK